MSTPTSDPSDTFATSYQHWFGPATFLRCPYQPDFNNTNIGLVGIPHCGGNPIEHMQYLGPRGIRNRSMGYARSHREFNINPFELVRIRDLGDVPMPRGLNLIGADIVCYCPPLDNPSQITAITGSMLMFEFVTLIAERLAAHG